MCGSYAMGPALDQERLKSIKNRIPLRVRHDLSPPIRLLIGSIDKGFLVNKSPVNVTLWDFSI